MDFPKSAIFAFNANIDHVRFAGEPEIAAIEKFSPPLASQVSECFAYGVQKEVSIDVRACEFLLSSMSFDAKLAGGQAGNAAQQASALGVKCFLHSNFANEGLLGLFSHPDRVFVASEKGFIPSSAFSSSAASAHHFVFESREGRTRFIASYDPLPLHPDDNFCRHIEAELPLASKAFIGGLHLAKTPERLRKFLSEIRRWKETNPKLQVFVELGEFQSREALRECEKEIFSVADFLGLNETELSSLSADIEELPGLVGTTLFHSQSEQMVLPQGKADAAALEFARRCASFRAATGKFASEADIVGISPSQAASPKLTVGLGDTLSCAYFMAARAP